MPCEIVLCVKNMNNTGQLVYDARGFKCGDVIEVQASGFDWGPAVNGEIVEGNPNGNHPFWRLLKLTNVSVAQCQKMLSPELDVDPLNPSPYLQRRGFFLDYTKIPAGLLQTYWNDDTRGQASFTLGYSAAQFNGIVTGTDDADCPAYHARVAF